MASDAQVRVSVRVPAQHAVALEKKAEKEDRTMSAEIRRLIRRYVEQLESEPGIA